jgi:hypothetical protein
MQFGKHATITFIKGLSGAPDHDSTYQPCRMSSRDYDFSDAE